MNWKTIVYFIIVLIICGFLTFQVFRIENLKEDNANLQAQIELLTDNNLSLEVEKNLKNLQLQDLQELLTANKEEFEKFKAAEAERVEVISKVETIYIEKGSENTVGVITSESSDEVKDLLNKKFMQFNSGE